MGGEGKQFFEWLKQATQLDLPPSIVVACVLREAVRNCPEWRTPEENVEHYKKYIKALADVLE